MVFHACKVQVIKKIKYCKKSVKMLILKKQLTYLRSLSSSPKMSRNTDPQKQTRFPLTTIIIEDFNDKNIPVPPPHSWECNAVSHISKIIFKNQQT